MNTTGMTKRMAETSPRFMARMAGIFYLMDFAFAPAMFAGSKFVVPGDAAVTATNMLAHESLFRLGFAGNLIALATYIAVTALFYELFKPVNRIISLLAAFFGYCQLNSRRNKNRESDKINRRSSSDQLTIALT